jgi:hypothetical protein
MTRFRVNKKRNVQYLTMRVSQKGKRREIYVGTVTAILTVINNKTRKKKR